ncbi:MAG: hypothetical protein LC772_04640 [Chloroflexi bacterium]|nr:hypothetical protein [Chloroflexota bacterium]
MDTWQGDFGWQSYALTGRPDLLNYLRAGDFTWGDLWAFYDERGLPPAAALARCTSLFHQFLSWELDLVGGRLEPGDNLMDDLMSWAHFCVKHDGEIPERAVRDLLVELAEAGSVSTSYFEFAYQCYIRAVLASYSATWEDGGTTQEFEGLDELIPCHGHGKLDVFVPEDSPELPIAGTAEWQRFKRAVVQHHHDTWCASYSGLMERMSDMIDERPAL